MLEAADSGATGRQPGRPSAAGRWGLVSAFASLSQETCPGPVLIAFRVRRSWPSLPSFPLLP